MYITKLVMIVIEEKPIGKRIRKKEIENGVFEFKKNKKNVNKTENKKKYFTTLPMRGSLNKGFSFSKNIINLCLLYQFLTALKILYLL